jgi:hypothetical protein
MTCELQELRWVQAEFIRLHDDDGTSTRVGISSMIDGLRIRANLLDDGAHDSAPAEAGALRNRATVRG